jgi:hypothetical protein
MPIAVIAADQPSSTKDNGDPLSAFGASLSGANDVLVSGATKATSQQADASGQTATTLTSAANYAPPSSLDATLDQLSKKRTIEPRTHGK